ncbi:uncharacterized protein V6R79_004250 [Siganus canaliculatus]
MVASRLIIVPLNTAERCRHRILSAVTEIISHKVKGPLLLLLLLQGRREQGNKRTSSERRLLYEPVWDVQSDGTVDGPRLKAQSATTTKMTLKKQETQSSSSSSSSELVLEQPMIEAQFVDF